MNLSFKKLTPELCEEYLYYFDNIAFSDHEEFSACYCLESHVTKEENKKLDNRTVRREKVKELIKDKVMQGYLVYDEKAVMGWCNVGDKKTYAPLSDKEHATLDLEANKVKSLYCIDIAPTYRGKGVSHLVLDKVCEDAKSEGYDYVEGYPFLDQKFAFQFHGPIHLYEKHGFTRVAEQPWFCIMSKKL